MLMKTYQACGHKLLWPTVQYQVYGVIIPSLLLTFLSEIEGEQHGYNIPTVVECGDLMQWVGEEGSQMLHAVTDNKALPDLPRRLLCDAYMCFYQSPKVMMYR